MREFDYALCELIFAFVFSLQCVEGTGRKEKTGNSCSTFLSKPCKQTVVYQLSCSFNPCPIQFFFQFLYFLVHFFSFDHNCFRFNNHSYNIDNSSVTVSVEHLLPGLHHIMQYIRREMAYVPYA